MAVSPNLSQPSSKKQVKSEGGGVPQWLLDAGVGPGEFFFDSKARARSIMKNPAWGEKARVLACLSLQTMAFASEQAVKLERGKLGPLRPADIAAKTGLDPRQVRRALALLTAEGYADSAGEYISLWAVPHRIDGEGDEARGLGDEPEIEYPSDMPELVVRYLRRYKIGKLPPGVALRDVETACENLAKAEGSYVESKGALLHIVKPKPDEPERTIQAGRKSGASGHTRSQTRTGESARVSAKISGNEVPDKELGVLESDVLLRERTERKKNSSSSSSRNGKATMTTAETEQVSEVLALYCSPDHAAVQSLIQNCRLQSKGATVASICDAIHLKGRMVGRKDNPLGFLMVAVPNAMSVPVAGVKSCDCGGSGYGGGSPHGGYCHCAAGQDLKRSHGR